MPDGFRANTHTSRGDPDTRPAARSAAGQHSFLAPRPVRCFAVGGPRLHAGAGLTLRPTAPSKLLLEDYSRNAFAVCSCGGVCWCGGSLRTGFPRGPEDAISTIPSRAPPVLLARRWVWRVRRPPRTGRGGADTRVVAGVTDRATGRGRAAVVERVDGPTLTGCVEGAGALATAWRRTAATRGSARPTACASGGCGIVNACRALIAWLTALVRSRLGGCPVFASAARWSPSRGSPVAERAGKTGKTGKRGAFTSV